MYMYINKNEQRKIAQIFLSENEEVSEDERIKLHDYKIVIFRSGKEKIQNSLLTIVKYTPDID